MVRTRYFTSSDAELSHEETEESSLSVWESESEDSVPVLPPQATREISIAAKRRDVISFFICCYLCLVVASLSDLCAISVMDTLA